MKDENFEPTTSVKDMVKVFSESHRPIFLPSKIVTKKQVSYVIPEEDVRDTCDSEDQDSFDDDDAVNDNEVQSDLSDEDELADQFELRRFLNISEIVDEKEKLLQEEEYYCQVLEELVESYINQLQSEKLNILDVFGRIDIISSYHNNTFLHDLRKSPNVLMTVGCFLKHKTLFNTYYDSFFRNQQNMIFVMSENKDIFENHEDQQLNKQREDTLLNLPNKRIQSYQTFLETIRTLLSGKIDISSFDRALKIITTLTEIFSKKEETVRFNISEIVETERLYVEKLEKITQKFIPKLQDTVRSKRRHKSVVGNVPSIYVNQISFYQDLKKCLYAFDPNEIGDCFLRNKDNFLLYVKDQQMKNDPDAIQECKELLKKEYIDFYAPLNRLYKYKLLLQELIKSSKKGGILYDKVEEALEMISEIVSQMNATEAINAIVDENIYLDEQGKLLIRDEFLVQYKSEEQEKPIEYNAMVYLFEKSIVFTEKRTEGQARNRRDVFYYKSHIVTKYLGIVANNLSKKTIKLYFHNKNKKHFYVLQATKGDIKEGWRKTIDDILMKQLLEEKNNA